MNYQDGSCKLNTAIQSWKVPHSVTRKFFRGYDGLIPEFCAVL